MFLNHLRKLRSNFTLPLSLHFLLYLLTLYSLFPCYCLASYFIFNYTSFLYFLSHFHFIFSTLFSFTTFSPHFLTLSLYVLFLFNSHKSLSLFSFLTSLSLFNFSFSFLSSISQSTLWLYFPTSFSFFSIYYHSIFLHISARINMYNIYVIFNISRKSRLI